MWWSQLVNQPKVQICIGNVRGAKQSYQQLVFMVIITELYRMLPMTWRVFPNENNHFGIYTHLVYL